MSPGTNIGAAHPVGIGGESGDSTDVMTQKVTNDAAALMRSIATKRGRNLEIAELIVRESRSYSEGEALRFNLINLVAKDKRALLEKIDGMVVETAKGTVTLHTKDARLVVRERNWKEGLLSFLSDPNVAYIFILLAMYGVIIELYNPGAIFPGVIGEISAILAGFSLQMLPVNYAGLSLIVVAIVLFILEIKIVSYGLLSIGGTVSFLLGSIMLIDSPNDFMRIGLEIIIPATLVTAVFFASIIYLAAKSQRKKIASGVSLLIGKKAVVIAAIGSGKTGRVKVQGEIWKAEAEGRFEKDDIVTIVAVNGLTLKVE
jgi:membrane-bound serine protease (ClpP class)